MESGFGIRHSYHNAVIVGSITDTIDPDWTHVEWIVALVADQNHHFRRRIGGALPMRVSGQYWYIVLLILAEGIRHMGENAYCFGVQRRDGPLQKDLTVRQVCVGKMN
jgi:hypothetical protein